MTTIGKLAGQYGLSRSTLLYYDRIGLLQPSGRLDNGYRVYTEADANRLAAICTYRHAGLSLADIRHILDAGEGGQASEILEDRLDALNREMEGLRGQQRFIISLLREPETLARRAGPMDKAGWSALMRKAGFSESGMMAWHREFEQADPSTHRRFLLLLGMPEKEIEEIIRYCRRSERSGEGIDRGI